MNFPMSIGEWILFDKKVRTEFIMSGKGFDY